MQDKITGTFTVFVIAIGKIIFAHSRILRFFLEIICSIFSDQSRGVELTNRGRMSGGILLVDMNFSGIRQLFTKVNSQGLGYVYLINSDGDIIYHPKQNLIFSSMMKENNKTASQYDDGVYDETFQGEDRTVIVKTVGYTGWKIVSVTPKKIFYQNANRTRIVEVRRRSNILERPYFLWWNSSAS